MMASASEASKLNLHEPTEGSASGSAIKPMEETISFLLAQVCKAHRGAANHLLSEFGLHAGQEMVLLSLWRQCGMTQSQLAEELCVEAPTLTRMVQRLEKAELLARCGDADDARVSRVHITAKGRALQEPVAAVWNQLDVQTLQSFTLEERVLLRRLLLQVQQNLAGASPVPCDKNE